MLERQEQVIRLTTEAEILRAAVEPPSDTRAYFRGVSLTKFAEAIGALNWDSIEFQVRSGLWVLDLKDCVDADTAAYYNQVLDRAESVEALRFALGFTD